MGRAAAEGTGIFTRYLQGLDPGGEPPDVESFDAVVEALRGILRRELRRRGLWTLSPGFLGIDGHPRWSPTPPGGGDALDELALDGYEFVFVDRLESLRAQLRLKPNVDGLVFLNVGHFVYERQRRHDPLGARIFAVLRGAVSQAVGEERLHVAAGDAAVRNDTLLSFGAEGPAPVPAGESELRQLVVPWMETLLPDLVVTRGKGHARLLDKVDGLVGALAGHGVAAFLFKHLVDAVKAEVRGRWAAVFAPPESVDARPLFEERESFRRLIDCVAAELGSLGVDEKTSSFLRALWEALVSWAGETSGGAELNTDKSPSHREIARLLGIPRDRVPGLYEMLGGVVRACRAATRYAGGEVPAGGEMSMDYQERRNRLRRGTGEAVARAVAAATRGGATPRPGDVYVLRIAGELPFEWVVLESDAERVVAVPADTDPLAGSADVVVPAQAPGGALTLRCAHAASLPRILFEPELRSRRLAPAALDEARRRAEGERDAARGETDQDPEYQDAQEAVADAVRAVAEAGREAAGSPGSTELSDHEVTRLLQSWSVGSLAALDELIPLVFDDLHRMACYFFQRESGSHTLQPTALISLLYLRLRGTKNTEWTNREDFFNFAAELMRHVLVDYARRRKSKKRGGEMARIPLAMASKVPVAPDLDVVDLDAALAELAKVDARQSRIVELRYFVGLGNAEIAELLGISEATVKRDWRTARFWLHRRMTAAGET
ncbi:MAG TPA: sigma-70 family RNA polymerase sigma factor [Thermoanaerobaculia bacterium]|jgi:RNA polymerase sigma factor (TIGR02999 family)